VHGAGVLAALLAHYLHETIPTDLKIKYTKITNMKVKA